ncbi:hypothetical protein F4819DRAFT_483693 [Hypoxylon fuscum]|nr:hypothetical protein F4819DRAFT_483693 [Hypoxylon fuscum]
MLYGAPYSSVYLKAFFAAKLIGEDKAAPPMDPVVMGSYHGRDPEKRYHASSGEKEKLLKELFGNGRHLPEYNTFSLLLMADHQKNWTVWAQQVLGLIVGVATVVVASGPSCAASGPNLEIGRCRCSLARSRSVGSPGYMAPTQASARQAHSSE